MFSVCYVTVHTTQLADSISSTLVKSKLAACVNIIPQITSVYEWKGEVKVDPEILLMIKTQTSLVPSVITAVRQLHTYDVPEIISVPMGEGSNEYLEWVRSATSPPQR
eukprot:GILI01035579.1.p1 GENE.GILI01035579.1~~GILI01035579.1.p1  ORF type:complete len:108 (+),score=8.51 GILI01035579.1:50-373(+)